MKQFFKVTIDAQPEEVLSAVEKEQVEIIHDCVRSRKNRHCDAIVSYDALQKLQSVFHVQVSGDWEIIRKALLDSVGSGNRFADKKTDPLAIKII